VTLRSITSARLLTGCSRHSIWTGVLRLCVALFRFWDMRGTPERGPCPDRDGAAFVRRGAYPRAGETITFFSEALATLAGRLSGRRAFSAKKPLALRKNWAMNRGIAASLNALAIVARDRGDYASAQANFERSLACWRLLPDRLAIARCLHNLANVVKVRGDYPRARWALERSDLHFRRNWTIAAEPPGRSTNRAILLTRLGDMVTAREFYGRALSAFRKAGDPWGSARSLTDLGYIDCEQGKSFGADTRHSREAMELFARIGASARHGAG